MTRIHQPLSRNFRRTVPIVAKTGSKPTSKPASKPKTASKPASKTGSELMMVLVRKRGFKLMDVYDTRYCVKCKEVLGYSLSPKVDSVGACCAIKADRKLERLYCKNCRNLIGYAPYRLRDEICEECG
jgi:RNase P subunit RPR2